MNAVAPVLYTTERASLLFLVILVWLDLFI